MKAVRKMWGLVAVGLLVAGAAWGQSNIKNTGDHYENQRTGQYTDTDGNAKITDAARDRDYYTWVTLINNQLGASGSAMADSNVVPVITYPYNRLGLMFYGTFDSLSTQVEIAVQVRAHPQAVSDSSNTFPWYRWRATSAVTPSDSIGHNFTLSAPPQTPVQTTTASTYGGGTLFNEFIVKFNYPAMEDSTGAGNGKPWRQPRGIYVPLTDNFGTYYWAPYTSVRVRTVSGVRNRFKIRVDLVGSAK